MVKQVLSWWSGLIPHVKITLRRHDVDDKKPSGKSGSDPRLRHTKDFKNGTWYVLA